MLSENEDVISFYPGTIKGAKMSLGRIVVHDRLKMEGTVLPRYFNHSSFASLRRQLNYFSFTRVGKGRQRGATYCNDGVVELDDILRLKRRSTVGTPAPTLPTGKQTRYVSDSSASSEEDADTLNDKLRCCKKIEAAVIVSPRASPDPYIEHIESDEPNIVLDLTVPMVHHVYSITKPFPCMFSQPSGDADVLAGCHALLSFSRSTFGEMVA